MTSHRSPHTCPCFSVTAQAQARWTTPGWHHADVARRRILATPFELQIATARYDVVPVHLRILSEGLGPDLAADHVVEIDLQLPSGKLVLHTVADDWNEVPDIRV